MNAQIEILSDNTIEHLTTLSLELWPECDYDEEKEQWQKLMHQADQYCALVKVNDTYVGFIHISTRYEYVEGADADKIAYLEGIYVKPAYRNHQIATSLLKSGEAWATSKGLNELGSDTEIDNQISQLFHQQAGFKEVNRIVCYMKTI